jgi:hypothetical protein
MTPHLVRWHEEMADKGLVVVAIEDGRRDDLASVERWVEERKVPHPVLHDGSGANVARFLVRGFPSAYLVGRTGKVVWEGTPRRGLDELERTIREHVGS